MAGDETLDAVSRATRGMRKLSAMTPQAVSLKTKRRTDGDETVLTAKVTNTGAAPALNLNLNLNLNLRGWNAAPVAVALP